MLGTGIEGALETMCTFIEEFDGSVIADSMIEMFTNINWERVLNRLSKLLLQLTKGFMYLAGGQILDLIDYLLNEVISTLNSIQIELPDWLGGEIIQPFDIGYVDLVGNYFSGMDELIEGLDDAYYGYGQSVKEAKEVTVQSFEEMEDKSFKATKKIESNVNEFGFFATKTFEYGSDTIENYNNGLESRQDKTSKAFEKIKATALEHLDVSNQTLEMGEKTISNYNAGVANQEPATISKFEKIKSTAVDNLNLSNQSNEWGTNTLSNYNIGVGSQQEKTNNLFATINKVLLGNLNVGDQTLGMGEKTIGNYNTGVINSQPATNRLFSELKSTIYKSLDNAQKARELGGSTATGYKEGFEGTARHFSIMSTVKDRFRQALGSYNEARQWGSDMATGFKDGLNAKQQEIIDKVRGMANSIRSLLHFSRPDEGPLRDYETWMPDMIKGLSDSLLKAQPVLDNAVNIVADKIANTLGSVTVPNVEQSVYSTGYNTEIIKNIGNKMPNTSKDETTTNMIRATYEAVSRALSDNTPSDNSQVIQVNIGNRQVYKGYGQYQDEESNMLGVSVS